MNDCKTLGIRLEDGVSLPLDVEELAESCDLLFCDVTGFGELEWVELAMDAHATSVQRFDGPLQLVQLNGRLRLTGTVVLSDFVCTLSRQTDNGIQLLGGRLHRAEASYVELAFSPLAPFEPEKNTVKAAPPPRDVPTKELHRSSSQPPSPRREVEIPAVAPSPPSPAARELNRAPAALDDRWAKAVLESNRAQENPAFLNDEDDMEISPKRGDIVHHAQFGECRVSRIDDDHITLRKPDGRNVPLGLTVLNFISMGKQDGKDVFRVKIGKR